MKGFAKEAVLLLPRYDSVRTWSEDQVNVFNKGVLNFIQFVNTKYEMSVCMFNALEVEPIISKELTASCMHINSICKVDAIALQNEGYFFVEPDITHDDSEAYALKELPPVRGITSFEERDNMIVQRQIYVMQHVVKNHARVVIDLQGAKNRDIKVVPKEGDNKIIIKINLSDLRPEKTWLSGEMYSPRVLLDYDDANRPISRWRP